MAFEDRVRQRHHGPVEVDRRTGVEPAGTDRRVVLGFGQYADLVEPQHVSPLWINTNRDRPITDCVSLWLSDLKSCMMHDYSATLPKTTGRVKAATRIRRGR